MAVFFVLCYFLQVALAAFRQHLQAFNHLEPPISHPNRSGCARSTSAVRLHLLSVQDLGPHLNPACSPTGVATVK
jgi:hypothetical protein